MNEHDAALNLERLNAAMGCLRNAIFHLRRTPDGMLDNEMAEALNAIENEHERLRMLADECRDYLKTARAG